MLVATPSVSNLMNGAGLTTMLCEVQIACTALQCQTGLAPTEDHLCRQELESQILRMGNLDHLS